MTRGPLGSHSSIACASLVLRGPVYVLSTCAPLSVPSAGKRTKERTLFLAPSIGLGTCSASMSTNPVAGPKNWLKTRRRRGRTSILYTAALRTIPSDPSVFLSVSVSSPRT